MTKDKKVIIRLKNGALYYAKYNEASYASLKEKLETTKDAITVTGMGGSFYFPVSELLSVEEV